MGINNSRAKDIFFKFGGSHFQMEREGKYLEYKKYKISKHQEYKWIQEYQKQLLSQIKNEEIVGQNFHNICTSIEQYKTLNCLKELVEMVVDRIQKLDTFSILLMIEDILEVVESLEKSNLGNKKPAIVAKDTCLNLLKCLLERPVTISSKYLQRHDLIDLNDNQQILNRIKHDLEDYN